MSIAKQKASQQSPLTDPSRWAVRWEPRQIITTLENSKGLTAVIVWSRINRRNAYSQKLSKSKHSIWQAIVPGNQ